jgi:hypothetical protein
MAMNKNWFGFGLHLIGWGILFGSAYYNDWPLPFDLKGNYFKDSLYSAVAHCEQKSNSFKDRRCYIRLIYNGNRFVYSFHPNKTPTNIPILLFPEVRDIRDFGRSLEEKTQGEDREIN